LATPLQPVGATTSEQDDCVTLVDPPCPHRFIGEGSQFEHFRTIRLILQPQTQLATYHRDAYRVPKGSVMMVAQEIPVRGPLYPSRLTYVIAPDQSTVASALQGILRNSCSVLILRITATAGDSLVPQSSHLLSKLTLVQYCCCGAHATDQDDINWARGGPYRLVCDAVMRGRRR